VIKRSATGPSSEGKGWYAGPWDSGLPVAVGWADRGVNELHRHEVMNEVYLVARGESVAEVCGQEVRLGVGDMLVVEPGESHTFLSSSADYVHFVVQAPFLAGDKLTDGQA